MPASAKFKTTTTRDTILDAAVQCMRTLGLARTTTREIAQAAGLSEAALYKYFEDKTDLFLHMLKERLPGLVATLEDLPGRVGRRTVRANLEEVARVALAFYDQGAPVAASLFSHPELLARHQEHLRHSGQGPHRAVEGVATYLRAEQRAGRVAPQASAEAAAALLLGACLQRAFMCRFTGDESSRDADDQFLRDIVRTLMRALSPAPLVR